MRPSVVLSIASQVAYSNANGASIITEQTYALSAQLVATGTAAGTFKLQACNDLPSPLSPANWVDISGATVSVAGAGSYLVPYTSVSYQWTRAVFVTTKIGVQTIVVRADVAGNLNNKYFYLNSANSGVGYYVWFNVNGAGVDPAIAGRTGVPVAIATGAIAADVGAAVTTAVTALAEFDAAGTTTVTVTNSAGGPFTPMSDAGLTGFTFAVTAPTGVISATMKTSGV